MKKESRIATALLVAGLVFGGAVAPASVGHVAASASTTDSSPGATLVVDADGDADYQSIQAAVDNATDGDTIEVRPGTYHEQVVLDQNVTLTAPDGATLDGSTLGGSAIGIKLPTGSDAEPVIDGFTVEAYKDGFVATESRGAWTIRNSNIRRNNDEGLDVERTTGSGTVRNTTIAENSDDGIDADGINATADWTVRNSTLRQNTQGIDLENASGAWTIRNSTISGNIQGVMALRSRGDWTIRNTVVRNNSGIGVNAVGTRGTWVIRNSRIVHNRILGVSTTGATRAWTIRNATVANSSVGVYAPRTEGAWTIRSTTIRDTEPGQVEFTGEGNGIFAYQTTGAWAVHNSTLLRNDAHAINATEATVQGNATRNWWGEASGPAEGDCVGNVTCGDALSKAPGLSAPPTESAEFTAEPVTSNDSESRLGFESMAILGTLLAIVVVLVVLSLRIR